MFGRKKKAELAALPPLHRALVVDRYLSVVLTPAQWDELFASVARHEQLVRRQPMPARIREILVPLVRALAQDVDPAGTIGVTADLRGPDDAAKLHPGRPLQPVRPVTKIEEIISWDPWLVLRADLRNGAQLDLAVVDVTRIHKIRKRSASGKTKSKTKRKATQRLTVSLKSAKGAVVVPPAPSPATDWLRVSVAPKGTRHVVTAKAKFPISSTPNAGWQLRTLMSAIVEVVRWVPEPDDQAPGAPDGLPHGGVA